jgi:hypothetical protein
MTLILALALQVSTHVTFGQSVSPPLQTQGEVAPPMVVPAVTEFYGNPGYQVCDMGACTFVEGDPHDPGIMVHRRTRLTCLDKRRVLVTTEAGTALCILFPEAQSEWPPIALSGTTTASNSGALGDVTPSSAKQFIHPRTINCKKHRKAPQCKAH